MKQLTLSQAIEGFLLEKQAQHLSPHTVADYTNAYRKLQAYLGTDVPFAGITADQIRSFLGDLSAPVCTQRCGEAASEGTLQQDRPRHPHRAPVLGRGRSPRGSSASISCVRFRGPGRKACHHAFQRRGYQDAAGLAAANARTATRGPANGPATTR